MIESNHTTNIEGVPARGTTHGVGLSIRWQNGPMVDPRSGSRREQNGAFVEDVLAAAVSRLEYFQSTKFATEFNELAIAHVKLALITLQDRTRDREARGVEGTHEV